MLLFAKSPVRPSAVGVAPRKLIPAHEPPASIGTRAAAIMTRRFLRGAEASARPCACARMLFCRRAAAPTSSDSAATNSAAVWKRSAGTLAIARTIASSTASGTVLRTIFRLGTLSSECLASSAMAVGPENGGWPASI